MPMPFPYSLTKTLHAEPYSAISPLRPELSQAGKTVLITGGGTGIGFAIAQAFAHAGASTVIIASRRDLTSAVSQLKAKSGGTNFIGRQCDATDPHAIAALWTELASDGVHVDVLVLNAGVTQRGKIFDVGVDRLWEIFKVNVHGHAVFAEMFYKQAGRKPSQSLKLVNVSTNLIHDFAMAPDYPSYSLTKNSGTLLMQMIARDVSAEDMQVVSYNPGGIFTDMMRQEGFTEDMLPYDKVELPGQFAVWAASPEAKFLHGRFVHAKWDVDELREGPIRERIDDGTDFLKLGVDGL